MNPEQLAALAGLSSETKESKTIDYKVAIANKNGDIKSVGIIKLWKRFSAIQMAGIIEVLAGESGRVTIEELTGEAQVSNDEF